MIKYILIFLLFSTIAQAKEYELTSNKITTIELHINDQLDEIAKLRLESDRLLRSEKYIIELAIPVIEYIPSSRVIVRLNNYPLGNINFFPNEKFKSEQKLYFFNLDNYIYDNSSEISFQIISKNANSKVVIKDPYIRVRPIE